MAYEWTCPYCGSKQYSAGAHREKKRITCIYCEKEFENPYYDRKGDTK